MTTTTKCLRIDVYAPVLPYVPTLRETLLRKAGGITTARCIGSYIMPDGSECKEVTDVHTIFVEDTPENALWIEDVLLTYKHIASQQCVLYVVNGYQANFITE